MMRSPLLLLLLLGACATTEPPQEEYAARRSDVVTALYRQLDLVLARRAELAASEQPADVAECAELQRLAAEIALQILQVDPSADAEALVERVEGARE